MRGGAAVATGAIAAGRLVDSSGVLDGYLS
jgi:hypothetical protein